MKPTVALAFSIFLLFGCGPAAKETIVVNKNEFLQCESSQVIEKKWFGLLIAPDHLDTDVELKTFLPLDQSSGTQSWRKRH